MQDLSVYLFVSFVTCVTPAAGVVYTVTSGLRGGLPNFLASPAGTTLGVALMCALSATGLGTLIASSPALYAGLQIVSALVLVWLGLQSWRSGTVDLTVAADGVPAAAAGAAHRPSFGKIFRGAVILQASNVMLIVFLLSLMPQFIRPEEPYLPQAAILSALFCAVCFGVHFVYSLLAALGSEHLGGPRFSLWLNRTSAAIFWLLAASVIWQAVAGVGAVPAA